MSERLRKMFMADPTLYNPTFTESDARFGPIKNVPVGTVFEDRKHCTQSGVHAPSVAGISGTKDGAFSIVLSGGYKDDEDNGETFIYTGTGGQEDSFGGKSRQVTDQTFNHKDNYALKKSVETGRPLRVVRGPNLKSKYAPARGYRYDGLYVVEKAYMGKSKDGYAICQYELRRVPGQRPLPVINDNY